MKLRYSSGAADSNCRALWCNEWIHYTVQTLKTLVCCCWAVNSFTTVPWGHYCNIAMLAGTWTCEIIHAWVCQWTQLHVSIRLWPAAQTLIQAAFSRLHSWTCTHTSHLKCSGVLLYSRPLGHCIIYSVAVVHSQQLSAWNSYEFILGPQMRYRCLELRCWHLRRQIYFPQLSITPSPHSPIHASCCCS